MLISLIVPCYNEEQVLNIFYNEIKKVILPLPHQFELIFVNDGSKDKTLSIIKSFAEKDERVKYISFTRNFGKEAAIYAGLCESKGDLVAMIDADLQDPPSLLPEMIRIITEEEYDCVATRRADRKGEPPIRSFFAHKFYKLIHSMTKLDIVDGARDFRLMKRSMADAIISLKEYHRFSKGIFAWVGFETKWIEFENIERAAGKTKWSFWKLFKYAVEGIISFTTVPLQFSTILGFIVSFFSFIYLLVILFRTLILGIDVPGYASLLTVILFLGGIQLLSIGVLGEYMAKDYIESKHRPLYLVKESNINNSSEK